MWALRQLCDPNMPMTNINEKWVPARPINWKYRTLIQRLKEAWEVFMGRADCFTWPEGQ